MLHISSINEKEAMDLEKGREEVNMRKSEGEKGKGNM